MALEKVILPIVEGLGYVFVGLQHFPQGRHSLLRLFVDKPGGITIDEIERISRQVNAVLDVESIIRGEYVLEVSSPGLDRLLFTKEQFMEFLGKQAVVTLTVPMEGKRNIKGSIHNVVGEEVSIKTEEKVFTFPFVDIAEARLVPEW